MEQSDWERVPSFAKNSTLKMQLFGLRSLQENNLCPLKTLAVIETRRPRCAESSEGFESTDRQKKCEWPNQTN
jgi:hypothetical protein